MGSERADREARLDALLDRQEIFDCLLRMCRGSDRFDRDLFVSSCHPDAVLSAGPFVGNAEEMYAWSSRLQADNYRTTMHKLLNFNCEIDGDVAHAETYYMFVAALGEESNLLSGGRYVDRFERRDGVWGLVLRNNLMEWSSIVPAIASPLGEIPDLHLNGLPAHDRSDPSYTRPLVNRRARNPMTGD